MPPVATRLQDEMAMRQAVRSRDATADGQFFYAVLSTGVFCYPSCAARPARAENLRFFAARDDAVRAGYRPCLRCRPDLAPRAERDVAMVQSVCRAIEAGCFDETGAAEAAWVSVGQLGRAFRRITGVTLASYRSACRRRVVQAALRSEGSVTGAIYEAGFSSSGRFYEAAGGMLGMTPTAWRRGGAGETIMHVCADSTLGRILVACTDRGICAILFGEDDGALRADLTRRFPKAQLTEGWPAFEAHVAAVVQLIAAPAEGHTLPLDIRGTAFQLRVWQALSTIPPGETRAYGALAEMLGDRKLTRAVAGACAANRLAVAIPCHRAVKGSGALAGYRWGLARKQKLLAQERGSTGQ